MWSIKYAFIARATGRERLSPKIVSGYDTARWETYRDEAFASW